MGIFLFFVFFTPQLQEVCGELRVAWTSKILNTITREQGGRGFPNDTIRASTKNLRPVVSSRPEGQGRRSSFLKINAGFRNSRNTQNLLKISHEFESQADFPTITLNFYIYITGGSTRRLRVALAAASILFYTVVMHSQCSRESISTNQCDAKKGQIGQQSI